MDGRTQGGTDFSTVSAGRKRIIEERARLEVQLREGAQGQLDATRDGLAKLRDTRVVIGQIREEMVNVDRLCDDRRTHVEGMAKITEVSRVHRHFAQTLQMIENLRDMVDKIARIEDMLAQERRDPLGPARNLLPIHFHLSQLETFRNETILQAKRAGPDARAKLDRYFERLGGTIEAFESHYLHLAGSLLDIARAGHPEVAVKLAKIAEVEGARDEKALAIRMVKKQNTEIASRFRSLQADARVMKLYRAKVMDEIRKSAKTALARCATKHADDPISLFDDLDWIYEDLGLVEEQLASRFPPDWKITTAYIKAYHKAVYDFLADYVKNNPDAGALLRIVQFCKDYNRMMTGPKGLEIPPELLTPKLLDGREQLLIEDYLGLIVTKMDEWSANLMRTETNDFVQRVEPPEVDADGMYGMQGAVIMFQSAQSKFPREMCLMSQAVVNQQVELACDSGQTMVLNRVVEEASRVMKQTQTTWTKLVEAELKKQVERPDDVPGGLVEYVMGLANDQVKSADFTEALLARLEPLVTEKYRVPISENLNEAMDGYLEVAKGCIRMLIDAALNDVKPAVKILFTNSWYVDDPMVQIVETIRDYMGDYQAHLNPSLFDLLVEDLLDSFIIAYLAAIRKASKLRIPGAADRFREDVRKSFGLFAAYKNPKELEQYFDVLDAVLKLITASKTMFFLDYWPFAKRYGANLPFVEAILRARDDLDKRQVSDIMDGIKRKLKDEELPELPAPSVFQRLPQESSRLAAFLPV